MLALIMPQKLGEFLNAPVWTLDRIWRELNLPPRHEAAFVLPALFFFLQWFLVGALIGLWCSHKFRRREDGAKEKRES
jgi:hypothetical protein